MAFDEDVKLERVSDGRFRRFRGVVSSGWDIGGNPNGGYLLSLVNRAIVSSIDHPDPMSVTTHFLRPGVGGEECLIDVDVIRTGRTVSTVRATMSQQGKSRLEVIAAYADLNEPTGVDTDMTLERPQIPPPENCIVRTGDLQSIEIAMLDKLDVMLHPDQAIPGGSSEPEISGWIRFPDGREPDTSSLLLFADTFPPSPFGVLGVVGWVPTIELTVHVRRKPAPGWIQTCFRTDDLKDGRMIETGALWDSEGQLVAQARQLGLVMQRE